MSMASTYSYPLCTSVNDFLLAMESGLKENRFIGGEILNNQQKHLGLYDPLRLISQPVDFG
jgi:hypothetical protein